MISSYYFLAGLCAKIATVLFWNLPIPSLFAATEVNGDWFNSDNEEELGSFSCEACVQVAGVGFKQIEARNEQEIWYMNRMRLGRPI